MPHQITDFVRELYGDSEAYPLHAPSFTSFDKELVLETINSSFVSSVGPFVDDFERRLEQLTGSPKVVATVNGTSALHASLHLAGVRSGDLVLTQAFTFVATGNAIKMLGADPIFCDISTEGLGLSVNDVHLFLESEAEITDEGCVHRESGKFIRACLPMHTFGHPVDLFPLKTLCDDWMLTLVEDAAESLGSFYRGCHTGTIGKFGAFSFNGNKVITTGGGGAIACSSTQLGERAKHVTTTAKVPHDYHFYHDEFGFNYRLPNINAALGVAQIQNMQNYLKDKRSIANSYRQFFEDTSFVFVTEPEYASSNYWLNAVLCQSVDERDYLLKKLNSEGVLVRPAWDLLNTLPLFKGAIKTDLSNSAFIYDRLLNLPSSPRRSNLR